MYNLIKVFENSLKNFRFINYILAVFILFSVLVLARNIVSTSFTKKAPTGTLPGDSNPAEKKKKDIFSYSEILEKNPFGRPMKLFPIAVVKQKKEVSYGALSDLVLVGTVLGPANLSYAIFEDKSQSSPKKQEVFAYKEKVFNHGFLTKISTSSVEIERDSMTYTLSIPSEKEEAAQIRQTLKRDVAPKTSFARKVGEQEYILDSRRVQKSLENPEQILTDARLLPNFVNGKQEGFKISEVVPDGLYHSLGIRNGDILLRVNGLEISNPEVAMQAMTALRGMNTIDLDIQRKGKNMSMNYQMR